MSGGAIIRAATPGLRVIWRSADSARSFATRLTPTAGTIAVTAGSLGFDTPAKAGPTLLLFYPFVRSPIAGEAPPLLGFTTPAASGLTILLFFGVR